MNIIDLRPYEIILIVLTIIVWLWQCFYLFRRILPVARYRVPNYNVSTKLPPISVVISARNEAENLERFLPSVLEQDYPEFQVVVVNDGSEDDSELILAKLKSKYK